MAHDHADGKTPAPHSSHRERPAIDVDEGRCRRRSLTRFAAAVFALFLLAGCDDVPITSVSYRLDNVRAFAAGVLGRGPMLVHVLGEPHDASADATSAVVVTALTAATAWIAEPRFTTRADEASDPSYRLVVIFNNVVRHPCDDDIGGGTPQPHGRVEIILAFCSGPTLLSRVHGRIGRTDGIDDRRFRWLIRQAAVDLLSGEHTS